MLNFFGCLVIAHYCVLSVAFGNSVFSEWLFGQPTARDRGGIPKTSPAAGGDWDRIATSTDDFLAWL
jgi:hypothetical protein